MGTLRKFNLEELIKKYNIKHYVESGTGACGDLGYALQLPFEQLHTIEINTTLYENAKKAVTDKRVSFYNEHSVIALHHIIMEVLPKDEPILFWLDGHYPGADYGLGDYHDPKVSENVKLPLEEELALIYHLRSGKDVILIDDRRIYVDDNYENGKLPWKPVGHTNFLNKFLSTHHITTYTTHEGYIELLPHEDIL